MLLEMITELSITFGNVISGLAADTKSFWNELLSKEPGFRWAKNA